MKKTLNVTLPLNTYWLSVISYKRTIKVNVNLTIEIKNPQLQYKF